MSQPLRYHLPEDEAPASWYNIAADLPSPPPAVLHPGTNAPIGPGDLAPLFPTALIEQEVSTERDIAIPPAVREVYRMWRPSPLHRARRLEERLGTPARIYYKYEGGSPAGSHKTNTAVAQVYYNKAEGTSRISTETGAGQWGSALAFAGSIFDVAIKVFMVRVSFEQKPYRKALMQTYGAECVSSPSRETETGRSIAASHPETSGSLGIAISEAVELAAQNAEVKYSLGSVLNHVLTHQTVIGQEALRQMELAGDYPDVLVACSGGGSNFAGLCFPFIGAKLRGGKDVRVVAAEPAACPTLTRGEYAYDFGDTGGLTPMVKMHTLGSGFIPPSLHAGGLRYHGMAPMVSHLVELGLVEPKAYRQNACFEAGVAFARAEGIVPAPEATHAVRGAIDEALACKERGEDKAILFNLSGHGHFDMQAYSEYTADSLRDEDYDEDLLARALARLPRVSRG